MQHRWSITLSLLGIWTVLLLLTLFLHWKTAIFIMPIILIILLLYISFCLVFVLRNTDKNSSTDTLGEPDHHERTKYLSHTPKE
jgi:hypothetical protein